MSNSSDVPASPNVQDTRNLFESFSLHYYAKEAPGTIGIGISPWKKPVHGASDTKSGEQIPDTSENDNSDSDEMLHDKISRDKSSLSSGTGSTHSSQCSTTSAHRIPKDEFDKLIHSENHYVTHLTTYREVYLNSIDDNEIKQKLDTFCRNLEQILTYHQNEFIPKFSEFEMSYASLFNLYEMYLNSDKIMQAYKNYAVVAANAYDILKSLCKDTEAKSASHPIDVFVKLPIHQNKSYLSSVDHYIKEYMRGGYKDAQLLEKAASLLSNFSKISKQIDETFKLYSIKQTKVKLLLFGKCEYSDLVSLDKSSTQNHRICIMDHGLICIKFKTIKDTKEEDYREIVFSHLYSIKIHLRNSVKNADKLHIDTVDQKSSLPTLTFRSDILKTKFSNLIGLKLGS